MKFVWAGMSENVGCSKMTTIPCIAIDLTSGFCSNLVQSAEAVEYIDCFSAER